MKASSLSPPDFPWLDRQEYPFQGHFFVHPDGVRQHYVDEGPRQGAAPLLFVHGTPSWSFDWRGVIGRLTGTHRCVAPDHLGFGLSDKPRHYDYSPQAHAARLEALVLALDLRDLTLVLHDFGGPIGFAFALRHAARIRRLVVLNSWLWDCSAGPEYRRLRPVLQSPLLPLLYRYANLSARWLLPASFGAHRLSPAQRRQYTAPFAGPAERSGPLAFARSLLHDQGWFGQLWENRAPLRHVPLLLIWGERDPTVPARFQQRFAAGFSRASCRTLPDCGHFPQEEHPAEVAQWIASFLVETSA